MPNLSGTHHNSVEYQRPKEFLPERWDHNSPLSLRPDGKKRSPFTLISFSGGRRICSGKAFSEYAIKIFMTYMT